MDLAIISEINQRDKNEDRAGAIQTSQGLVAVVCDGMGGLDYGDEAAQVAVNSVLCQAIKLPLTKWESEQEDPLAETNQLVRQLARDRNSAVGTTICILAYELGRGIHLRWLGDSRVYIFRCAERKVYMLSEDNNIAWVQREKQLISDDVWRTTPQQSKLTEYLGKEDWVKYQYKFLNDFVDGDIILLCTDGAIGSLTERHIAEVITMYRDDLSHLLIELFNDARKTDCEDNQTAICIRISKNIVQPDCEDDREFRCINNGISYTQIPVRR